MQSSHGQIEPSTVTISARRTEAGVLEEGFFRNGHLVTGRKNLPGGLMCEGEFNSDGSLVAGSLVNKPIYQQGIFENGHLVNGLLTEWSAGKPIEFEFGTRHHGTLIHGIRASGNRINVGDFYHHQGGLLRRGVLVEPTHVQVGYFSLMGDFDIGVNVIYRDNDGDLFEVGNRQQGHLDYGTRVQHLNTIEAGSFNPDGVLIKGIKHKLGDIHAGEFTDGHLVYGTHVNREGHVESGRFDSTTHEIREGHRIYGYKEDLNIYERGSFDGEHLTGFGIRVHTHFIEQGNFDRGVMHDGVLTSAVHMEYKTHALGSERVYRIDKQFRTMCVGYYQDKCLEGYRMNFDDFENPTIERIQNGRVLKRYQLVEVK